MIALTFFGITILVLINSFLKKSELFSPLHLYIGIWSFVIGLCELKLSGFQTEWPMYTWIVLFVAFGSFILGHFVYNTKIDKRDREIFVKFPYRETKLLNSENDYKFFKYSITILFLIYIVSYFTEYLLEGYIPLFSPRFDKARIEFGIFGLHLFVNMQLLIMFYSIVFIYEAKKSGNKYGFILAILLITFITFFFLLQRFNYFLWILMSIIYLFNFTKFVNIKKSIISLIVLFGLLYLIQSIRLSQYIQDYVYHVSKMHFNKDYAFLTEPYMYIVMNIENLSRTINRFTDYTHGALTFDWLLALTGIKHEILVYFSINSRPFINTAYNTFPYIWPYYSDFGIIGVCVFSFINGFLSNMAYHQMKIHPNIYTITNYCFVGAFILISFFTNIFTMLNIIFLLFINYLIYNIYNFRNSKI